jgi:hypothetical protein
MTAPDEATGSRGEVEAAAFIKALIGAWDCCGTCAGGVLAKRDRALRAAERERIAQAIEAEADKYRYHGHGYRHAARIARTEPDA